MRRVSLVITAASLLVAAFALALLFFGGNDSNTAPAATTPVTHPSSTAAADTPSPTATVSAGGPTGRADGPAGHDGERAMAILKQLSANPRVAGTAQEAAAATFISDRLRSYGYTTEVLPFEFEGDRFRAGTAGAAGKDYEALTLAGSPGGKLSAPAVHIGLADTAGIAGQDLTGKIAVADRGTLNFIEKYENAKAAGAIGMIIVNNRPGPFSGNLTTLSSFPVVAVSQEDGAAFIAAARAGQQVSIDAPPTTGPTRAMNVLARATPGGRCQVLVGGHFDSVPGAPGANDNGSGAANVIELARAFAADGMDEGLCFALFGAEESGLYGSKALVEQFEKAGQLPAYMVNLDVTGIGNDVEVIGPSNLVERALSIAKGLSIPAVKSQLPPNSGSDHQSFQDAGVPAVFFTSGDFATIHSPQDVFADISEKELDAVGDVAYATIRDLWTEVARGQARP